MISGATLLTFGIIFLWLWLKAWPYLLYQEQNQLFLFTSDYFRNDFRLPGGFADWLSEFIVQFDYIPLYGALLTSALLTLTQVFIGLSCRRSPQGVMAYAIAAIGPLLFMGAMGNENTLLSFGAAMTLTALFIFLGMLPGKMKFPLELLMMSGGGALFYWLAGGLAFAGIIALGIGRRQWAAMGVAIAIGVVTVWGLHSVWLEQYPFERLLFGINYYRIPEIYPGVYFAIALAMAAPLSLSLLKKSPSKKWLPLAACVLICGGGCLYAAGCCNHAKTEQLEYESLTRQGRWDDIILKGRQNPPASPMGLQALNLALGMKGQLVESMFRYPQMGIKGLIEESKLDNTSRLVTAEALYRLGLTNIAFATTFDLQEAIMNDRKSGRHLKRMAECMIINGNYAVAEKYRKILEQSLFYKNWAMQAKALIGNDRAVESHPVYGPMRRNAFCQEAFYSYPELTKILALQAMQGKGNNSLAWQYFCASALLEGDLTTLAGVCNSTAKNYCPGRLPRHLEEALAMYWTFSHNSFDGIPFPISGEVMQQTAALAQAAMQSRSNPAALEAAAPCSYGVYFLTKMKKEN